MWWRIGALALLAAMLAVLFTLPPSTVDVTVEIPRTNGPPGSTDADSFAQTATLISYGIVAAVLALMGWLTWQVVRDFRKPKD
jgi:hypothetical protein